jgi:type II restriction enzyme
MDLYFNEKLADSYESLSQKIRVMSEDWVSKWIFCVNCGNSHLEKTKNNEPLVDFVCNRCNETYELKSKKGSVDKRISDGNYYKKIERLKSNTNPNLFILNYDKENMCVINFFVIPKYFFVPDVVEKRKPLSQRARRSGWVGSNILLDRVPQFGKIFVIKQKEILDKEKVLLDWKKTLFLHEEKDISAKGWLIDIIRCIESMGKQEFGLKDIYQFEEKLKSLHPNNKHIKDKIRQQLQILRDQGYLEFVSKGNYRIL